MAASLGQRYANAPAGETEVSVLVGMNIEHTALSQMNPNSPCGSGGQSVQDRLIDLDQQQAVLSDLNQQAEQFLPAMSDQDWMNYKDRWRVLGRNPSCAG